MSLTSCALHPDHEATTFVFDGVKNSPVCAKGKASLLASIREVRESQFDLGKGLGMAVCGCNYLGSTCVWERKGFPEWTL